MNLALTPQSAAVRLQRPVFRALLFALCLLAPLCAGASDPASAAPKAPGPAGTDVLIFTNGDQLTGRFLRSVKGKAVFQSEYAGEITVAWDNIRELRSGAEFVVIPDGVRLTGQHADLHLPANQIYVREQQMELTSPASGATTTMPLEQSASVIDRATYERELHHQSNPLSGWKGTASAGATVVAATQKTLTFNGGFSMNRTIPTVDWLDKRNRTLAEFRGSYGRVTQSATAVVRSAIFHAAAERDEYFSPHLYALAQSSLDRNSTQSLKLQQIYGAGLGRTFLQGATQSFDTKATMQFQRRNFYSSLPQSDQRLFGSTLAASYSRKLVHGIALAQQVSYLPAWNDLHAYALTESNSLVLPISRRLGFSLGTMDSYLNNPVASSTTTRRNSFQFTMGAQFTIH